jgi:hypothetical protein
MADPNYRDPRFDPQRSPEDEARARRVAELSSSNAMWGWIAGAVVIALILAFVFTQGQGTNTASNEAVPRQTETTGMAPPRNQAPPATRQAPRPAPSTIGQGTAQ